MAELMHELAQAGSPGNSIAVTIAACASKVTSENFIFGISFLFLFFSFLVLFSGMDENISCL